MIGLRTGLKVGPRVGLAVGVVADEIGSGGGIPAIQLDGSSSVYRPTLITDWAQIDWPIPTFRWDCQESSGNLTDDVRDAVLTVNGTVEYQVASSVLSYASRGIGLTPTAGEGFTSAANTLWNCFTQAVAVYFEFEPRALPAGGTARQLFCLTGSTGMNVALFDSGGNVRMQARGASGNVNGTANHPLNVRYAGMMFSRPGATILDFTNPGIYTVQSTAQTTPIAGTFPNSSDGVKGLGAAAIGALLPFDGILSDFCVWTGDEADECFALGGAAMLDSRGW